MTHAAQDLLWIALKDLNREGVVAAYRAGADVSGAVVPHGATNLIAITDAHAQEKIKHLQSMITAAPGILSAPAILGQMEQIYERRNECITAMIDRGLNPLLCRGPDHMAWPAASSELFATWVRACLAAGFEDDLRGTVMHTLAQTFQPRAELERAVALGGSLADVNVHGQTPLHVLWGTSMGHLGPIDLVSVADVTRWAVEQHEFDLGAQDYAGMSVVDMMERTLELVALNEGQNPSPHGAMHQEAHRTVAAMVDRFRLRAELGGGPDAARPALKM